MIVHDSAFKSDFHDACSTERTTKNIPQQARMMVLNIAFMPGTHLFDDEWSDIDKLYPTS